MFCSSNLRTARLPRPSPCLALSAAALFLASSFMASSLCGAVDKPAEKGDSAENASEVSALLHGAGRVQKFLDRLNSRQHEEIRRKRERFKRLKSDEQERLRKLHQDLVDDPQGERLYQVLVRYQQWLKTLSSSQRAELAELSTADRLERIRRFRQVQEQRRFVELSDESRFNADDASVVIQWLGTYLENHADELIRQVPSSRFRGFLAGQSDPHRRRRMLGHAVVRFGDQMDLPEPSPQEFEQLAQNLSRNLATELRGVKDSATKSELVRGWLHARMLSAAVLPDVSQEELIAFYTDELPSEERERLERLPADEMRMEIKRIYYRTKYRQHWGSGRSRRPDGPPPRHRDEDQRRPSRSVDLPRPVSQ